MERAIPEDKDNERSKRNGSDIKENTENSDTVGSWRNGHLYFGPRLSTNGSVTSAKNSGRMYKSQSNADTDSMPLPLRHHANQTCRKLKRSRPEAELDEDIGRSAAGGVGGQFKRKHVD